MKKLIILIFIFTINNSLQAQEIKKVSNEELNHILNELYAYGEEDWFGVYVKDQNGDDLKLGYAKSKIERIENKKNEKLFIIKLYCLLNLKTFGLDNLIELNQSEVYQADPPYNFLNGSSYITSEGMYNAAITTLKNNELFYLELSTDKTIQLENINIEYKLNDIITFEALAIKDQLKVGDIYYTKSLDKNVLNYEKNTILEVNNTTIDGVSQKYYKMESIWIDDGEEYKNISYGNAKQIISFDLDLGDGFVLNLRIESKEKATDLSYTADLYVLNAIHLDENFHEKNFFDEIINISQTEDTYIDYLNFEITGEYNDSIDENYINQKITKQNNVVFLDLGYNYNFNHEIVSEKYYDEAIIYSADHPELKSIATEAISNPLDKYDEIYQLITWINENTYQFAELNEISDPYEILKREGGDCTEITDLFNALAKSIGIPARSVTGYVFGFEDDYSFGGHQWSEVEINGIWVPVDATWNMWVETSPFHIKVKDFEKSSKDFTKKFKLKLKEAKFSNGKIINYNENGTKTIN